MFRSDFLTGEDVELLYQQAFRQHEARRLNAHINYVLTGDDGDYQQSLTLLKRLQADYHLATGRVVEAPVTTTPLTEGTDDGAEPGLPGPTG